MTEMTSRHLALRVAAMVIGGLTAFAAAGVAAAEPDSGWSRNEQRFLSDVTASSSVGDADELTVIAVGYGVCSDLSAGASRDQEAGVVNGRLPGTSVSDARIFVALAAKELCPLPIPQTGDEAGAERAVQVEYADKQRGCTPDLISQFQYVTWDPPGFSPQTTNVGVVHDATPGLGGQFRTSWTGDRWNVEFLFC